MRGRLLNGTDGSAVYVTSDGDMVDAIAAAYYGKHEKHTETVLDANPHVAELGPLLPAGVSITLPRIVRQVTPQPFRQLWD